MKLVGSVRPAGLWEAPRPLQGTDFFALAPFSLAEHADALWGAHHRISLMAFSSLPWCQAAPRSYLVSFGECADNALRCSRSRMSNATEFLM